MASSIHETTTTTADAPMPVADQTIDDFEARHFRSILSRYADMEPTLLQSQPHRKPAIENNTVTGDITLDASMLRTEDDWKQACLLRWEDAEEIRQRDPFWLKHLQDKPTADDWASFFHWLDESERRMLKPTSQRLAVQETPENALCLQRGIRIAPSGNKHQDFARVFVVGASRHHLIQVASLRSDPDRFFLWRMLVDDPTPAKCDMVLMQRPSTSVLQTAEVAHKVEDEFKWNVDDVWPVWERTPNSAEVPGKPVMSCMDPASGAFAVVYKEAPTVLCHYHGEHYSCAQLQLPLEEPDYIACNQSYVAVAYNATAGTDTQTGESVTLPPHIYVYRFTPENPGWCKCPIVVRKDMPAPPDGVDLCHVEVTTCMSFHRRVAHILLVGTKAGAIRMFDCSASPTANEIAMPYYPAPGLQERARLAKQRADKMLAEAGDDAGKRAIAEAKAKEALEELQQSEQSIIYISGDSVGAPEQAEPRILVCYTNAVCVVNSRQDRQQEKLRIGKVPTKYIDLKSTRFCAEAYGGMLALHDAFFHQVDLASLARVEPRLALAAQDLVQDLDVTKRPYPSMVMFAQRVVILHSNGFVAFHQLLDARQRKLYLESMQKALLERLSKLSMGGNNGEKSD